MVKILLMKKPPNWVKTGEKNQKLLLMEKHFIPRGN